MTRRSQITRELKTLRGSVLSLQSALSRLATSLNGKSRETASPKRKLQLSAGRRAALKLQGQYMGHMRGLKPRQKTQVKALKAAKGMPAAIVLAQRLSRAA
jgi:hypothetical protein